MASELTEVRFKAGATIVADGEPLLGTYIVKSGVVHSTMFGTETELEVGDFFGAADYRGDEPVCSLACGGAGLNARVGRRSWALTHNRAVACAWQLSPQTMTAGAEGAVILLLHRTSLRLLVQSARKRTELAASKTEVRAGRWSASHRGRTVTTFCPTLCRRRTSLACR